MSPQAEKISGHTQNQWLENAQFWQHHVHPDDLSAVLRAFRSLGPEKQRVGIDHRFRKPRGEVIWFHTEVHRDINSESGEPEPRGLSVDITQLKEEIRLRDEFLWIASHELKTPITPLQLQMQGFLRMLETGRFQSTPETKMKEMLEISDAQVTRLGRLIRQLFDVSRVRDGKLKLEREPVDLADLIRDVHRQLQHELSVSECSLQLELCEGVVGHYDRLRLEQVLINLLMNAMKYAAGKPIWISLWEHKGHAVMAVRDFGIGIPKYDQERIFKCFERGESIRNYVGLGLGLYISQQIIELHGGTITVESQVDQGSTFFVNLPLIPLPSFKTQPPLMDMVTHELE